MISEGKNYKFKFSVIIPIYNVEDYLEETIESVINQTIGFEDNIELILVNDGSPDNSEAICLKYKELYPDNIKYIKKENGGVSSARNLGIENAEGELINFLDSDDKWSLNSFEAVYNAYLEHPDIKLFSTKMVFFDGRKGNHLLNYKYVKNRVIDIFKNYKYPQLSSSSIFIVKEVIGDLRYCPNIKYSEDNRFINEIILKERYFMVLSKPIYYYRRRNDKSSAIQGQVYNESYYKVTPKEVYQYLFDYSRKLHGKVISYIQYLVLYDLSWRITIDVNNPLITKSYLKDISNLIKQIDEYIILEHRQLDLAQKIHLLCFKYNCNISNIVDYYDDGVVYKGRYFANNKLGFLIIDNMIFRNNKMFIYGKIDNKYVPKENIKVLVNGEEINPVFYDLTNDFNEMGFDNKLIHDYIGISLSIDVSEPFILEFYYNALKLIPRFKRASVFFENMPYAYHNYNGKTIVYHNGSIICEEKSFKKNLKYEYLNEKFLCRCDRNASARIRLFMTIFRNFKLRKIMLISDRVNKADDNGEHLFKYVNKYHKEINSYYIISKKSPDYKRMKKYGKVLDNESLKYKLLFQISDYIVSSHAENYIFEPLGNGTKYIRDQYYFRYIFLQHGIIKDDLSPWLNINTKKMDMFVTSCEKEYQSLLDCKYYFGPDIVKLTGLPRFDSLLEKSQTIKKKKQIMVSFTWRNSLASTIDKTTGKRLYNEEFVESLYYQNINKLFMDEKLHKVLKETGYIIRFIPHPNLLCQMQDFKENEFVQVEYNEVNYQKEFCENALLITDYSSTFFDFAYLHKPVIYFQYDQESFYENQLYNKGYFVYEKDGFGPVCYDYDSLVKEIIKALKNDCKLEDKYEQRINSFYKYHDQKNSERVFNEIMKLK